MTYFDLDQRLDSIEFGRPAHPMLNGIDLLALDMSEARALCQKSGGTVLDDGGGPISQILGIGIWSSGAHDDPYDRVDAVLVFKPEYFEQYRAN